MIRRREVKAMVALRRKKKALLIHSLRMIRHKFLKLRERHWSVETGIVDIRLKQI